MSLTTKIEPGTFNVNKFDPNATLANDLRFGEEYCDRNPQPIPVTTVDIEKADAALSLKQDIMSAWQTEEDLDLIIHHWDELTEDERLNSLIGLKELHDMRCNRLFESFESFISK